MRRTIWSRGQSPEDMPVHVMRRFTLFFVHGHDGVGNVPENCQTFIINLDNSLGKYDRKQGEYSILYSHENSEYDQVRQKM